MMDSPAAVVALIIVAIMLVGGAATAQFAVSSTGDKRTFTEEFNTSAPGDIVEFNQSNVEEVYYSDTVNVTDENGTLMRDGQDYEWIERNGTLRVLSGELENDTDATIRYSYRDPSPTQVNQASRIATLFDSALWIPLALLIALLVAALGVFGGLS